MDSNDTGCLLLIALPAVLVLVLLGHGDWIVGAVTLFFIGIVIIVTVGEVLGEIRWPEWMRRRRD